MKTTHFIPIQVSMVYIPQGPVNDIAVVALMSANLNDPSICL